MGRSDTAMTRPRRIIQDATHLVTRRITQRQFLLTPSPEVVQVYLYCLGYALLKHAIDLHAYCVMSNHVHLDLTDRGACLPAFKRDLNSLSARALNRLHGRRENLWSSDKPSYVDLAGPEDILRKIVYTITNPVAAGLVESSTQWSGAISRVEQIGGEPISIRRPDFFFNPNTMPEWVDIQLVAPEDCIRRLGDSSAEPLEVLHEELRTAIEEREAELRAERSEKGQTFLGMQEVLAQDPLSAPTSEGYTSSDPKIAAVDRATRRRCWSILLAFYEAYDEARQLFIERKYAEAVFPRGTYHFRVHLHAQCEPFAATADTS